jgi:hypothetical protein
MTLNISATWHQPVALTLARSGFIYECPEIEKVPETAGVYVFGRRFGASIQPLYVGRAANLQKRLWDHLNSVKLMLGIKDAQAGERFFMCCEVNPKPGQKIGKVLEILESALITHLLSEGHELLQIQGTKRPNHTITFDRNEASMQIAPKFMRVRASE